MNDEQQVLLEKAKIYNQGFLSQNFGKLYLRYCDEELISPQEFITRCGNTKTKQLLDTEVKPAMPIDEYIEIYKKDVLLARLRETLK